MNTAPYSRLKQLIVEVLKDGGNVTSDQLLPRVRADTLATDPDITKKVLLRALRELVTDGKLEKEYGPPARYRIATIRYRWQRVLDTCTVERLHPFLHDHWTNIGNMTEAEARTCVTALNELDRKARAVKAG